MALHVKPPESGAVRESTHQSPGKTCVQTVGRNATDGGGSHEAVPAGVVVRQVALERVAQEPAGGLELVVPPEAPAVEARWTGRASRNCGSLSRRWVNMRPREDTSIERGMTITSVRRRSIGLWSSAGAPPRCAPPLTARGQWRRWLGYAENPHLMADTDEPAALRRIRHDLRGAYNELRLCTEVLLLEADGPAALEWLDLIERAARRCDALVCELDELQS
jgi:hypothetical protein